jgi:hypothetical protein
MKYLVKRLTAFCCLVAVAGCCSDRKNTSSALATSVRVYIVGWVQKPGKYSLEARGEVCVADLVALAGGLSNKSKGAKYQVEFRSLTGAGPRVIVKQRDWSASLDVLGIDIRNFEEVAISGHGFDFTPRSPTEAPE